MMSWGISKIHGATRQSDSVSFLRFPLCPQQFIIKLEPHAVWASVFSPPFPFIDVGTWVFLEEQGSLFRSLVSSNKPDSTSNLASCSSSSHTLQKFSFLSHCQILAWESSVSLIMSTLSLFLFLSMEIYLALETDNILPFF